jgi:hypothetical protein
MYKNYLEDLSLSFTEKDKIAKLGASNAAALLAMMQAAPEDFERYLGSKRCLEIIIALRKSIGESEQAVLETPVKELYSTGAIIDRKAPKIQPPKYNIAERDCLFEKIQELRQQHDPSPATRLTIDELEQELTKMLQQ